MVVLKNRQAMYKLMKEKRLLSEREKFNLRVQCFANEQMYQILNMGKNENAEGKRRKNLDENVMMGFITIEKEKDASLQRITHKSSFKGSLKVANTEEKAIFDDSEFFVADQMMSQDDQPKVQLYRGSEDGYQLEASEESETDQLSFKFSQVINQFF